MNTMMEINDLSKQYEGTKVLDHVSLKVKEGEFLAIMGQSGSGKSTLLYHMSGMDHPDSGNVVFRGEELTELSEKKMSEFRLLHMGFIFQHSYLLKNLSIRDNIVLPGVQATGNSRDSVCKRAEQLLKKTGIEQIASHDIRKVSGGQLQRAAICRALINRPEVLFADEPTGALNSSATMEVLDLFSQIHKEGTTIVLVTHDVKVAARADRVIFLMDGRIHEEITLEEYGHANQNIKERETRLQKWLADQGF